MHFTVVGVGPTGVTWFVWCETCARGSHASTNHNKVRDLLAAHVIDPHTTPVSCNPDEFVAPPEIAAGPPRYL